MERKLVGIYKTIVSWILYYRNWPSVLKINILSTKKDLIVNTRSGIKVYIRPLTSDFGVFNSVVNMHEYCPKGFEISPDDVVLDLGANIGSFSLYSANIIKGGIGKIYAFEPMLSNYKQLKKNILLNNFDKIINSFKIAVSNNSGQVELCIQNEKEKDGLQNVLNMGKHTILRERIKEANDVEVVDCMDLNDILEINNIAKVDFLKIDVEGAEYEIIFNCNDNTLKKIRRIAMEYHEIDSYNPNDLVKFLTGKGFSTRVSGHNIFAKQNDIS